MTQQAHVSRLLLRAPTTMISRGKRGQRCGQGASQEMAPPEPTANAPASRSSYPATVSRCASKAVRSPFAAASRIIRRSKKPIGFSMASFRSPIASLFSTARGASRSTSSPGSPNRVCPSSGSIAEAKWCAWRLALAMPPIPIGYSGSGKRELTKISGWNFRFRKSPKKSKIPGNRDYVYGVFNPYEGVGTPFFGGYYRLARDDD